MDDLKQRLRNAIVADAFEDRRILSGPLAERLIRERHDAAAALDAKDAEIARLREALQRIAEADDPYEPCGWAINTARAALTAGRGD